MSALTLIKRAQLFDPSPRGQQDVLLAGGQIVAIDDELDSEALNQLPIQVIDGSGKRLVPGFVDSLTHIIGGGGEGGFATRTPEMQLSDAIKGGVTTVVGALGTDSIARTHSNLIAKVKGLKAEGLSAYAYTGSYQVPVRSLGDSAELDILFVDEIIGVGEVAISDTRSSQPTIHELAGIASEARVAGMLAGKSGIVSIHVGPEPSMLEPLWQTADQYDVRLNQFYPTHINRNEALFNAGLDHARMGGYIDFTASTTEQILALGEVRCGDAIVRALAAGISPEQMSMSTDGHASLPSFDEQGNLVGLQVGQMDSMLKELQFAVLQLGGNFSQVLTTATLSPANILGLSNKGRIAVGADADLLLLDEHSLALTDVFCRGQQMMAAGECKVLGTFEQP